MSYQNTKKQSNSHHYHYQLPLGFGYSFGINIWVTLVFLITVSLLFKLGTWQLERRTYKLSHNEAVSQFLAQQKQPLSLSQALDAYQKIGRQASDVGIQTSGRFLSSPIIFHDNRVYQGRVGLNVLAFFKPDRYQLTDYKTPEGMLLLVNLGWVSWPGPDRSVLPMVSLPSTHLTLKGTLFAPNPDTLTLETTPPPPSKAGQWLLQKIDLEAISQNFSNSSEPFSLSPFTLRLSPNSDPASQDLLPPHATKISNEPIRDFKSTTHWPISPEKHLGYAIQWFLMALIVTGLFIFLNLENNEKRQ